MPMFGEDSLRIGAPDDVRVGPLCAGLAATPGVDLCVAPLHELAERYAEGAFHCALVPPWIALRAPKCRLIPGLGLAVLGPAGFEALVCEVPLSEVRELFVSREAAPFSALAALLVAEAAGQVPACVPIGDGSAAPGQAVLSARHGTEAERVGDLGVLWHRQSQYPLVLYVWAGGLRAPYARLRQVLGAAAQRGRARLEGFEEDPDDMASRLANTGLRDRLNFGMGSLETEGLRHLIALAARHGMLPHDTDVVFC